MGQKEARYAFRLGCLRRDGSHCVLCDEEAVEVHHIMDRKLFADGGYDVDNGASVCNTCHWKCEENEILPKEVRASAGIKRIVLPPHLDPEIEYDKWGHAMFGADKRIKYPKSTHLPWSPGLQNDDRRIDDLDGFIGKDIVITAKMDGENTTMYRDAIHARSIDMAFTHPSRAWVRALHGAIKHNIPEGWRLCGENLYAQHSIVYTGLPSYFMLFSIWTDQNECLSWSDTEEWARLLDIETVPVLYKGSWEAAEGRLQATGRIFRPVYSNDLEGYVVRTEHGFSYNDFHKYLAKYVRAGHIQTDEHWMQKEVKPNGVFRPEL